MDGRYKGLGLAMRQYYTILELVRARGGRLLRMDVLAGALERAARASLPLRLLLWLGGGRLLLHSRALSYSTQREQFEAVRMYVGTLYVLFVLLRWLRLAAP